MLHSLRAPARKVTIGVAARQCGLTPRGIRLYEEHGLVVPSRDAAGVRYFDDAALRELAYIAAARRAGLTLRQIAQLLAIGRDAGEQARAERMVEWCRARLEALDAQTSELRSVIETLARPGASLRKAS